MTRKRMSGRGNSKGKDPQEGACSLRCRIREEGGASGGEVSKGKVEWWVVARDLLSP